MAEPKTYHQRRFALPPEATELVLVRHGASQPAVEGVAFPDRDGHADPPLDVVGHEQAAAVAARLAAGDAVHALFHTGLTRTEQTAEPIASALGLTPRAVPGLREVHLGEWEGGEYRIRMQNRDPAALKVLIEQRWDAIPGAEAADALEARVRSGVDEVVAETGPGRRAVCVLHGGIIGEICRQAADSRPLAFVHSENTSVTRVVVFDQWWLVRDFNSTSHLASA